MVLADRIRLANTRQLLRAFGGLNETYGCSEAEYSAGVNFSTRDFPALSTRTPRRRLQRPPRRGDTPFSAPFSQYPYA